MAETDEKAAGMTRTCLLMALLLPLSGRAFAAESEAERGREVYQKWCAPCHGIGLGKPGTSAAAAHGVKPAVLEQRADLTPKMIETAVRTGVYFMPRFRKTEISNADLAAIIGYLVHK
jgi:mono/diheme cytochrome c family protein